MAGLLQSSNEDNTAAAYARLDRDNGGIRSAEAQPMWHSMGPETEAAPKPGEGARLILASEIYKFYQGLAVIRAKSPHALKNDPKTAPKPR